MGSGEISQYIVSYAIEKHIKENYNTIRFSEFKLNNNEEGYRFHLKGLGEPKTPTFLPQAKNLCPFW